MKSFQTPSTSSNYSYSTQNKKQGGRQGAGKGGGRGGGGGKQKQEHKILCIIQNSYLSILLLKC